MHDQSVRKLSIPPFAAVLRWPSLVIFLVLIPLLYYSLFPEPADLLLLSILGLIIIITGMMAFSRGGLLVDDIKGTLTKWWGLFIPLKRSTYLLSEISHVRLTKNVVMTGKGARVTYPVTLARKGSGEVLIVEEYDYTGGRRKAEGIARFLNRDLHDETTGEVVVRESQYLDEPVAQRHRRLGLPAPFRQPPPGASVRIRSTEAGAPLVIEIPATGFRLTHLGLLLVVILFPLLIIAILAVVVLQNPNPDLGLVILFVVLFSPWFLAGLLLTVNVATQREIITVSPAGIRLETRSWVRRSSKKVAAEMIEEIVPAAYSRRQPSSKAPELQYAINYSAGGRAVLIRTDQGNTGIGHWVPEAEQLWLRDILIHGLVDDSRST